MSRLGSCLEFERGARECEKINFETRIYPKDSENRYRSLKFNGIFLSLQRGNKLSTLELRGGRGGEGTRYHITVCTSNKPTITQYTLFSWWLHIVVPCAVSMCNIKGRWRLRPLGLALAHGTFLWSNFVQKGGINY